MANSSTFVQKKCEMYWPEKVGEERAYGKELKVRTISCESYSDYALRVFNLTKGVGTVLL